MKIGILNASDVEIKLANTWSKKGNRVFISQSKSLAKNFTNKNLIYVTPQEVIKSSDIILISSYWLEHILMLSMSDLSDKVIIDASDLLNNYDLNEYYNFEFLPQYITTQELQMHFPDLKVVKAFSRVPVTIFTEKQWPYKIKPSVLLASDHPIAKIKAKKLMKDFGFQILDAGNLKHTNLINEQSNEAQIFATI